MGTLLYWWLVEPIATIALVYAAFALALRVSKKKVSVVRKLGLAVLLGLPIWALLPAWDTVYGRRIFGELCASEAGTKAFQRVPLPQHKIGKDGLPVFFNRLKITDRFGTDYRFEVRREWVWTPRLSDARIRRDLGSLYDARSNTLLAQDVSISFRPGGVPILIAERKWLTCPGQTSGMSSERVARAVFEVQ